MSQILADAEMVRQLEEANGPVQMVDEKGTVIAVCTPIKFPHSPYTRVEVEAIRKRYRETREGKPLSEILKGLQALDGACRVSSVGNGISGAASEPRGCTRLRMANLENCISMKTES